MARSNNRSLCLAGTVGVSYRDRMIKVGIVGLGKMGLSHYALMRAHPEVEAIACDASKYVLGVLEKNTAATCYGDYETMLAEADLDAVVIATPSSAHASWCAPPSSAGCTSSARSR